MMLRLLIIFLGLICFVVFPQSKNDYQIYLLKENNGVINLEALFIGEGETKSIKQSEFITFVLPVSPGKSGDIIQSIHKQNTIKISAAKGKLFVSVIKPDGSERTLPEINFNDLKNYLIRVNVISGSGTKKAFFIKNYNEYGEADGPVFDLFGGKIPLASGDYAVTTEVTESKHLNYVTGNAPLEIYDNLLFVKGKIEKGNEGYFIIDFGAGRTVFSKDAIPQDNTISKVQSIEYSSDGIKTTGGEIGAAGGNVSDFLGTTDIKIFKLGGLVFNDLSVSVLNSLPVIAGKKILGIIGIDLLQSAPFISIEYKNGKPGKIFFETDFNESGNCIKVPFSLTGKQIFVNGKINSKQVSFLFDTGARFSFVSEGLGLPTNGNKAPDVRGLDGNIIPAKCVDVKNFSLGNTEFQFKDFYSADIPVINNMGLKESGALLGGDFLKQFNKITVDYSNKILWIEK